MSRPLRVAVVGGGPAGLYTAQALIEDAAIDVEIDVLDRLPTPFGLVRYGVAPDHQKMKSVSVGLQKVLDDPAVRLFGGVQIGRDATAEELRASYDAVVYAVGAPADRRLGIPGEHLPGSVSATEFVRWYSGHPDQDEPVVALDRSSVAVVGLGNVAVDVSRILLKSVEDLEGTDMPQGVLDVLAKSEVTDVHVLGRRGPADARWTSKELRELLRLTDVDVVIDPADLVLDEQTAARVAADRNAKRCLEILTEVAARPHGEAGRRLHLHFFAGPSAILGGDRVEAVRVGVGGREQVIEAGAVLRSIGYLGVEVPGVPFDPATGTIPSDGGGRVLRDGVVCPGEYVSGWARRGPSGVIGTNRPDGVLVAESVRADLEVLTARPAPDRDALPRLLAQARLAVVDVDGWAAIDAAEVARGAERGCARVKLETYSDLLLAAHG